MQYKIVAIFHITLLYIVLIIHQFIQIPKIYDISGDPILLNSQNAGLRPAMLAIGVSVRRGS